MTESTIHTKSVFEGRLIRLEVLDVELEDGTRTTREIVRHPGAVAVVAQLPDDRLLFVRQYRKPVEQFMIEVIAGTREPGEDPVACARREVEEETGHRASDMRRLGSIYPSPGYVDEEICVFAARVAPADTTCEPDEDERVEPVVLTMDEIHRKVRDNEIRDAKTLAAWHMFLNANLSAT